VGEIDKIGKPIGHIEPLDIKKEITPLSGERRHGSQEDPQDSVDVKRRSLTEKKNSEDAAGRKRKSSRQLKRSKVHIIKSDEIIEKNLQFKTNTTEVESARKSKIDAYRNFPTLMGTALNIRNLSAEDKLKEIEKHL